MKPPFSSPRSGFSKKPSSARGAFGPRKSSTGKSSFGGNKSFGEKKAYGPKRSFGDKPAFGDRKPFGPRKSYGDRPSFGDKPAFGERKSFGARTGFGPKRSFGGKPSFGDRKPFGPRKSYGDRPSFGDKSAFGDRKPFGPRKPFSERTERPEYPTRARREDAEGRFPVSARSHNVERNFTDDFKKRAAPRKAQLPSLMNDVMAQATNEEDALKPRKQKSYLRTTPGAAQTTAPTTSWGNVAEWYDKHLEEEDDTYHRQVILPNLTRLVDPKSGERILEIACGQGFFARRFQEAAPEARIEGFDLGEDLIAIAKSRAPQMNFRIDNAEEMATCTDHSFDTVYCVLAIQNIANLDKLIENVTRVLVPGGTFHIVMNHPVLRVPKESSWEYVDDKGVQARRVDAYLSPSQATMDMHPGMANSPQTLSFHRSLQTYFKALTKFGLAVDRLEEWISHKISDSGPRAKAENKARKEIPMFMYLRARKG